VVRAGSRRACDERARFAATGGFATASWVISQGECDPLVDVPGVFACAVDATIADKAIATRVGRRLIIERPPGCGRIDYGPIENE
jgi:hypothetical protein